jgi:hypothetical protein
MKLQEINFDAMPKYSASLFVSKIEPKRFGSLIAHTEQICTHRPIDKIYIFKKTMDTSNYEKLHQEKLVTNSKFTEQYYKIIKTQCKNNKGSESIIIFDEVTNIYEFGFIESRCISNLLQRRAKLGLTILWSMKKLITHGWNILKNDYIFFGADNSYFNIRKIYHTFPFLSKSIGSFRRLFITNTEKFNYLVVHLKTHNMFSHNVEYLKMLNVMNPPNYNLLGLCLPHVNYDIPIQKICIEV